MSVLKSRIAENGVCPVDPPLPFWGSGSDYLESLKKQSVVDADEQEVTAMIPADGLVILLQFVD